MAKLADILVTLTLDTKGFYEELGKAGAELKRFSKDISKTTASLSNNVSGDFKAMSKATNDMSNLMSQMAGMSSDDLDTMSKSAKSVSRYVEKMSQAATMPMTRMQQATAGATQQITNMGNTTQNTMSTMVGGFNSGSRSAKRMKDDMNAFGKVSSQAIDELPDHLKEFAKQMEQTTKTLKERSKDGANSLDDMRKSLIATGASAKELDKLSKHGKDAIKTLREFKDIAAETQLAILGLDKTGKKAISMEQSQKQMEKFRKETYLAWQEVDKLRKSGNFSAYTEGMKQIEMETKMVRDAMNATVTKGSDLEKVLKRLGMVTTGMGNTMAMGMERFRNQIILANKHFNTMDTTGKKVTNMMKSLGTTLPMTGQTLKLASALEMAARKGNALNLAFKQMDKDAPMSDILKRTKEIQAGVGRAIQLQMYSGIATGFMVYGLIQMSNALDGRLLPAFEKLKNTWGDALTPFINAFTTFVLWIMNGAQALGNLANSFAQVHPMLSQMVWGFLTLVVALTTLLAPLAIGIGYFGGLRAMFAVLYPLIASVATAFLTIVGIVVIVAAAIVGFVAVIQQMWTHSENLRNAWNNLTSTLMSSISTALAPLAAAWDKLKQNFMLLLSYFTGGQAKTMGDFWQWLGDKVAFVVNWITANLVPIFIAGINFLVSMVTAGINGLINVFGFVVTMWSQHGDQIKGVLSSIWSKVQEAFTAIVGFVKEKMPQIKQIVSDVWDAVKTAFAFTMTYIVPKVQTAFQFIWKIIQMVMPFILDLIKSTWDNIKNVISSALDIIQNVVQLFSNVLKGNWKGAWENVKNILKAAVKLVWNLVQLWFLGKVMKIFGTFAKLGKSKMSEMWQAIVSKIKTKVSEIQSTVSTKFNSIKDKMLKPVNQAKDKIKQAVDKIKSFFSNMKLKIPKPHIPKISVTWDTMGKGKFSVKVPKIHWNATGNIFNGASILGGGQGVGEAGAEAVMPIERKRYMKPYASMVASLISKQNGSNGTNNTDGTHYTIEFNQPVIIREEADIIKLVKEIERKKIIQERAKGVFSYRS